MLAVSGSVVLLREDPAPVKQILRDNAFLINCSLLANFSQEHSESVRKRSRTSTSYAVIPSFLSDSLVAVGDYC